MTPALPTYTCKRCDHTWNPRVTHQPKRCPGCGSPYWHKDRLPVVVRNKKMVRKAKP